MGGLRCDVANRLLAGSFAIHLLPEIPNSGTVFRERQRLR